MFDADVIIAGAGSAGCVLAARLSEDPKLRVLLIEAGPPRNDLLVSMPAGCFKLMGRPQADWTYRTTQDASARDRSFVWSGGKMLGGSSAINGLVYIRGQRQDYADWEAAGAAGWSFDDVLPYFMKSESFEGTSRQGHGTSGPLSVSEGRTRHKLADVFLEACTQAGLPWEEDYCNGSPDGAFLVYSTMKRGKRSSTAAAFLEPAMKRPNLRVETDCLVDKVLIEDGKAVGIRVRRGVETVDFRAAAEVIVSAGTIGSPAILMRSGIGPADAIQPHGIAMVQDIPAVGRNLQEHNTNYVSKLVDMPTYNSPFGPLVLTRNFLNYMLFKRGPMASAAVQAMAYARSSPDERVPDLVLSFLPVAVHYKDDRPAMHPLPGIKISGHLCRPKSRGRITLRSSDPEDRPIIDHQLIGDSDDVARLVAIGRLCARIFEAPTMKRHVKGENAPSPIPHTDAEWEDFIRSNVSIGYHSTSTCRMGEGPDVVCDPHLRVRGVQGLRVADASVMPNIISGNTNAPTIMIAERAAEFVAKSLRA